MVAIGSQISSQHFGLEGEGVGYFGGIDFAAHFQRNHIVCLGGAAYRTANVYFSIGGIRHGVQAVRPFAEIRVVDFNRFNFHRFIAVSRHHIIAVGTKLDRVKQHGIGLYFEAEFFAV